MEKTFTIAGTSLYRGQTTRRVANGSLEARKKILTKGGHLEVNLFQLERPMTKAEIDHMFEEKGISAVAPKTGRGSGLTDEQIAAQQNARAEVAQISVERAKEIAEADMAFFASFSE